MRIFWRGASPLGILWKGLAHPRSGEKAAHWLAHAWAGAPGKVHTLWGDQDRGPGPRRHLGRMYP